MIRLLAAAGTVAGLAAAAALAAQPAPNRGAEVYRRVCFSCHALDPGRNTPAGPTLHGLAGRPIAGLRGFNYSPALRRFAAREGRWTRALLERFLADPDALVPGIEMSLPRLSAADRQAVAAWLSPR
ncbi:MAG TPA: c-type cytochrome [Allosphingosinicella sp.]|nr:c-type cytochrome [Allosphingosinicella sp.]